MDRSIFIYHAGRTYPCLEKWGLCSGSYFPTKVISKLDGALKYRRNPRTREYMEALARQVISNFGLKDMLVIDEDQPLPELEWDTIGKVVLLWPDANGTGWSRLERGVLLRLRPSAEVVVLNGRRRCFALTKRHGLDFNGDGSWKRQWR